MTLGMRLLIQKGIRAERSWKEIAFMVNSKYGTAYEAEELAEIYQKLPHLTDAFRAFSGHQGPPHS